VIRQHPTSSSARPFGWIFVAQLMLALQLLHAGGCAGGKPVPSTLHFHSLTSDRVYSQTFPRAYVAEVEGGEYDAVLVANENDLPDARNPNPSGPIGTTTAPPLRHVLHIRVLWRPQRGMKADAPTLTNAVVTWDIRRSDIESSQDRLQYQGAGFVMVYPDDNGVSFSIRNLTISLRDRQGNLPDPIGRATIEGNFYAVRNAQAVRSTLDSVRPQTPPTTQPLFGPDPGANPPRRAEG
jgi:hypothetical protein